MWAAAAVASRRPQSCRDGTSLACRIWEAVTDDLPPLKAAIEAMIAEVEREDDRRYGAKKIVKTHRGRYF